MARMSSSWSVLYFISSLVLIKKAAKPTGGRAKGGDSETGSSLHYIDWRKHYDADFILQLHVVFGEKPNITDTNTTEPFLCTYCQLSDDDQACHELDLVCWSMHGCYRQAFIKYGERFVNKGCWHNPIELDTEDQEFGECDYCPDDDDDYNCYCETCKTPMCNSVVMMAGSSSADQAPLLGSVLGTIALILV